VGRTQPDIRHNPAVPESKALHRVLLVEDDLKLARTLERGLSREGYAVDLARDGDDALAHFAVRDYDVVVLDILLPGSDGHQVCRELRARDRWVPVLMLTALGSVEDRIHGLDTGADDYLVKPFDFGELLARVRALIRRGPSQRPSAIEVGALRADPATRVVSWAGHETALTPREYQLLEFMLRRPRQVISRSQLLDEVWSEGYGGSPNVVDVYIGYLRRKLERASLPPLIRTVRGAGFVLDVPS
jgi:two-component system, OmpR family, response regulator